MKDKGLAISISLLTKNSLQFANNFWIHKLIEGRSLGALTEKEA